MQPRAVVGFVLAVAAATACAHIEAPTGGPEDKTPPTLVVTRPDTFARVSAFSREAVLVFSEAVSEQRIEEAVSVSPRTSAVAIDHAGDEIRVSLRRGWEAGRIYQIIVDRTVQDLFGNRLTEPARLVFSTGPAIPDTRASGSVTEWITGKAAVGARVEMIRAADSLVYAVHTDSTGSYLFRNIPEGAYRVRAFTDVNRNRAMDPFEPQDSVPAPLRVAESTAESRFRIAVPDTSAPRLGGAALAVDTSVALRFDDYLDPEQSLDPGQVRITGPGGVVPIRELRIGGFERVATAAGDTSALPAERTAADTVRAPTQRLPSQTLSVRTSIPLRPGTTYQVEVLRVRNLHRLVGGGTTELKTPPAAAVPADTSGVVRRGTP